ncbi:MAG: hypothetical protein JWQ76_957 [Ramlibacter sp.]|nr:hypothetical protein [Ramlibacter sp.]
MFDLAPVPMWIFDSDTMGFLDVNQAALDQYGYLREEFLKLTLFDLRVESEGPQLLLRQQAGFEGRENGARHRRKDGSEFRIQALSRPLPYLGRSARFAHILDVSALVDAESRNASLLNELKAANAGLEQKVKQRTAALVRQEALFRTLAEQAPLIIWTVDATGAHLTFANRAWYDLLGGTPESWAVRGARLEATHPEDREAALEVWRQALETRSPFHGLRRLRGADGRYRTMSCRGSPVFGADGAIEFWVGVDTDVTDLKDAEETLQLSNRVLAAAVEKADDASRSKSAFLATVSHEIRTPMNGLLGLLELLSLSPLDSEQQSTLATVRESGRELLAIVDDVLDFSKIEAHCLELHVVTASIAHVVERACRVHRQTASKRGLALRTRIDPAISPQLRFDPARLGQILNNFLNNAIKFTERGSVEVRVELVSRAAGIDALRVIVQDTGIGLTAEHLARLFKPFAQGTIETSSRFGGTGLGLVICRRLAELMGGTVEMSSELGRGTTLVLSIALAIPRDTSGAPVPQESGHEALATLMKSRRVAPGVRQAEAEGTLLLLVDDHPTNRTMLMSQVSALGYAAECAEDGNSALAAWRSGRFGALLLDCNMPGMSGYELATRIRSEEGPRAKSRIAIIGCTADAQPAVVAACREAGMDDCLVKPASLAQIGEKLGLFVPLPSFEAQGRRAIDLGRLAESCGGSVDDQAAALAEFLGATAIDAADLRRVAAADDPGQVEHFVHLIRGASLMIGATALAEACGLVASACAQRDLAAVRAAITVFDLELLRLEDGAGQLLRPAHLEKRPATSG